MAIHIPEGRDKQQRKRAGSCKTAEGIILTVRIERLPGGVRTKAEPCRIFRILMM